MSLQSDLDTVLAHCRALAAAADDLELAARARSEVGEEGLRRWWGPYGDDFADRLRDEQVDGVALVRALRDEADEWARLWADTVNTINAERRATAVADLSSARGFGERTFDRLLGDDSSDLVPALIEVTVPVAVNGYGPSGGLQSFGVLTGAYD